MPPLVLLRVLEPEMPCHLTGVDRHLQMQGPTERLPAHCQLEALRSGVQPCTSARHPMSRVRPEHDEIVSFRHRDHSQQSRPAIRLATPHTCAVWLGTESSPVGHTSV